MMRGYSDKDMNQDKLRKSIINNCHYFANSGMGFQNFSPNCKENFNYYYVKILD